MEHRMDKKTIALVSATIIASAQPSLAEDKPAVEFLNSGKVVPATLPFSEAVRAGDTLYLSGQVGIKPGTMQLVPGGIREEARQALENIRISLEAHGYSMRDVIKCTVMLADISEWATFNEVYKTFFSAPYPARSAFGASGLALGARVEVECVAATAGSAAARP
jgi:reactive intermediate/imine deaminase